MKDCSLEFPHKGNYRSQWGSHQILDNYQVEGWQGCWLGVEQEALTEGEEEPMMNIEN